MLFGEILGYAAANLGQGTAHYPAEIPLGTHKTSVLGSRNSDECQGKLMLLLTWYSVLSVTTEAS